MYTDMEEWTEIRLRVLNEEASKREILREKGMHWKTLQKILSYSEPPGYRMRAERPKPKIGPFLQRISEILEGDKEVPKKQRHTAKRIYERIKEEGYQGKYTQVKEAVNELKSKAREVFMPLTHRPGEAQVDFGEAVAKVSGDLRKVHFLGMALPYSDSFFVASFERECTETYWEGHIRAFEFFEGVPYRISYDNTKVLVSQILQGRDRKLTRGFLQLQSHYLFDHHFCRVRRPNEKGVVEGLVKYVRLNFFVPVPEVRDLEELNERLAQQCQEDLKRRLRGKVASKGELLKEDQAAFRPLPAAPLDACRKQQTIASSLSLVRFDTNDYSVPVRYAHHSILAKGYADRVVLCHKQEQVAQHRRSWGREGLFFDWVHYLPLLERKPGSLDHALPLAKIELPECFEILHRRLKREAESEGEGTRQYIRVLRLIEVHGVSKVAEAVTKGLRIGAHTRDAVAQFLIPQAQWKPSTFRLDGREHLQLVKVDGPDLSGYQALLSRGDIP
jgi:transposase